ncbi:gamma-tubulin complex component 5-like [Diadema antillarum]|uniref:gamma-tubulin complex component 5-like n=1 Tax=Diadema antillarum TaxID=105358 RepID=UPI003A8C5BF3
MEQTIKNLVKKLTGFRDGSENFKRTVQFVQSNFRFHRYLTPDSHKIMRTIDGIEEKLLIHSQAKKAAALKRWIELILNNPLSDRSEDVKSEAHYAVLSFLLNLSHSPSSTVLHERPPKVEAPEQKFDWASFLLEGLQPIRSFQESSDEEWSEEEEEEEEDDGENVAGQERLAPAASGLQRTTSLGRFRDRAGLQSADWIELADLVVDQYWDGDREGIPVHSNHLSNRMARHWEVVEESRQAFPSGSQRVQVTESQIIRESVWMLLGAGKSFVYRLEENVYRARDDLQVSHLTPAALTGMTRELAQLGSQLLRLQSFIDRMRAHPMTYCQGQRSRSFTRLGSVSSEKEEASPQNVPGPVRSSGRIPSVGDLETAPGKPLNSLPDVVRDSTAVRNGDVFGQPPDTPGYFTCQTYEAFAEALAEFISSFREDLIKEEKKVVAQEETYTLAMFVAWLGSWRPRLHLAYDVCRRGVEEVAVTIPSHRVFLLLQVLQAAIKEYYCLDFGAEKQLDLLWDLWSATTRPYISFISKWLTHGVLSDPAREFAIHRNKEIRIRSENYWKKAFSLQSLPPTEETDGTVHSQPANHRSRSARGSSRSSRREPPNAVPEFLQPVLPHVLLAGKSMEILESTGKLNRAGPAETGDFFKFDTQRLRHPLVEPVKQSLPEPRMTPRGAKETPPSLSTETSVVEVVQRQLSLRGYNDPLIARGISEVSVGELQGSSPVEGMAYKGSKDDSNLPIQSQPLELILYRHLYPTIVKRCQAVCTQLASVLKQDFRLQDHLLCLRRYFLLEAGDVMYDFYSVLFNKLRREESWMDALNLNYHLQETLSARYPDEAARIMISVEPHRMAGKGEGEPIRALESLTLHYKVPWPIDIIINRHSFEVYNQVFRFLLQVKRAQYCLQQVRFQDLAMSMRDNSLDHSGMNFGDGRTTSALHRGLQGDDELREKLPLIHRLHLLRFRLMHFVNAVHNYLMTRILYSTGLEFTAAVEEATDLDQILGAHRGYLAKVSERCLLHHKVAFVREAVAKVLNMAIRFQTKWDAGLQAISEDSIAKMEEEFSNCNEFLSTLLANIIRRGTFPHLEALALSLSGPKPRGKNSGDAEHAAAKIR